MACLVEIFGARGAENFWVAVARADRCGGSWILWGGSGFFFGGFRLFFGVEVSSGGLGRPRSTPRPPSFPLRLSECNSKQGGLRSGQFEFQ